MNDLRVAVIGCGRASESLHMPALAVAEGVRAELLVDVDLDRAEALAVRYDVPDVSDDPGAAIGRTDAALLVLPHHLHAPVGTRLLEGGLHVLSEKPLALSVEECDALVAAAEQHRRVLAVGMVRRLFPAARFARRALELGLLGAIEHVELREGVVFRWEVASDFTFRRDAGGGVLNDLGVHVLDLLGWWLGDAEVRSYRDDAMGGVDADCEIELAFAGGVPARVELSRTRDLPGAFIVEGERGRMSVGVGFDGHVHLELDGTSVAGPAAHGGRGLGNVREAILEQLEEFVAAVREDRPPLTPGSEGRRVADLLEQCRAKREPLAHPWVTTGLAAWR